MNTAELHHLLILRLEAQQLLERLREKPELDVACYVAAMLVRELAEKIVEGAGPMVGGPRAN